MLRAVPVLLLVAGCQVAATSPAPIIQPPDDIPCVVKEAAKDVGIREATVNGGPEVDQYLASVGLVTGFYWCSAFVHAKFRECGRVMEPAREFAMALRWAKVNPVFKRGDLDKYWTGASGHQLQRISEDGDVFTLNHGGGKGHTGIIRGEDDYDIRTIEGNTNAGGSSNGDGVYLRIRDKETLWTVNRILE